MNKTEAATLIRKLRTSGHYAEIRAVMQIIGDKWSVLILLCLAEKPSRFTDISTTLHGLNSRTLTQKLRLLQEAGLILRHDYKEFPPRIEYSLTQKAYDLEIAMAEISKWASTYYRYCP